VKKISFGFLKLEMVDLERFWRKTPLGPLGVKTSKVLCLFMPHLDNIYFTLIIVNSVCN
jgi:hypothetical protein